MGMSGTHHDLLRLLERIEAVLQEKNYPKHLEGFQVSPSDLEHDAHLLESFRQLYTGFRELTPITLTKFGQYIRNHPSEFVQLNG